MKREMINMINQIQTFQGASGSQWFRSRSLRCGQPMALTRFGSTIRSADIPVDRGGESNPFPGRAEQQ